MLVTVYFNSLLIIKFDYKIAIFVSLSQNSLYYLIS